MTDPYTSRSKGCLVFLAFCVVLGIAAGLAYTLWSRTQADDLRERWQARGLPTSIVELDAWYEHVPDDQNAALAILAALGAMTPLIPDDAPLPVFSSNTVAEAPYPMDETTLAAAEDVLAKNTTALALAHAAAALPNSRFPMDFGKFPSRNYDHLGQARHVARLLWLEGLAASQSGDSAKATVAFVDSFAICRALAREPLLISVLSANGIYIETVRRITESMSGGRYSAEQLQALRDASASTVATLGIDRALVGESTFPLFGNSPANTFRRPFGAVDRDSYAGFVERSLDAQASGWPAMVSEFERLENGQIGRLDRYIRPITSIAVPAMSRSYRSAVRSRITHDLFCILSAVEGYRLKNGGIPSNLNQLVPEFIESIPQDPYGMGYAFVLNEPAGYVIYCVGIDGDDDRGANMTDPVNGDITLRVTR
jgi:hypothetical protein